VKGKYWKTGFKSVPPHAVCGDCAVGWDFVAHNLGAAVASPLIVDFAFYKSIQMLELEMGPAVKGGGFEFFNKPLSKATFKPFEIALHCMDQGKTISDNGNLEAYMQEMNKTSSQFGLGDLGVARMELWCSSNYNTLSLTGRLHVP
jgi:hypothetical protein